MTRGSYLVTVLMGPVCGQVAVHGAQSGGRLVRVPRGGGLVGVPGGGAGGRLRPPRALYDTKGVELAEARYKCYQW